MGAIWHSEPGRAMRAALVDACPMSTADYTSFVPLARRDARPLVTVRARKNATMRTPRKRNFRIVVLLAALVAAGALVPLAWQDRQPQPSRELVQTVPTPAPGSAAPSTPVPAAEGGLATTPGTEPQVAAAPAAEEVPPGESETDASQNAAAPSGPTLSFGRAAGLHLAPDPLRLNSSAALVVD